jgi:uncharacterized protein DUF5995
VFPYDSSLLTAVRAQPKSIDEVMATMQSMETLFAPHDGLFWFHQLYFEVTRAVKGRVAGGGFSNPAWLAELDVQFAALYFSALEKWLSSQITPECWLTLFARRELAAIARIQFALAGVNAHINHDLPIALIATCQTMGSTVEHDSPLYADYTAVNSTLDALIETAKRELMVRLLGDPLPPVSHLEDTVAAWSVAAAREMAWTNAEVLWGLRGAPLLSGRYLDGLDGITAFAGKTLLVPVPL